MIALAPLTVRGIPDVCRSMRLVLRYRTRHNNAHVLLLGTCTLLCDDHSYTDTKMSPEQLLVQRDLQRWTSMLKSTFSTTT